MPTRFSDINRGPELNKAYQSMNKWRNLEPAAKQAAYKKVAKPKAQRVSTNRIPAYIVPFGPANPNLIFTVRGIAPQQTGAGSNVAATARNLLDNRIVYDLPANPGAGMLNIKVPRGFKPATIIVKTRVGEVRDNHESRFTGRPYPYAPTESVSSPFGRTGTETTPDMAMRAIRASTAYETFVRTPGNTVTFKPEIS